VILKYTSSVSLIICKTNPNVCVFLQQFKATKFVKKLPGFVKFIGFITVFTKAIIGPLPELLQSSAHLHNLFILRFILILSSNMPVPSKWPLHLEVSDRHFICNACSPLRSTCPAHLINIDLICLIISNEEYTL
jgi:hypothetical protein